MKGHILLIGFMGVGKTTVSRNLSSRLNLPEVDTDRMIVEQEGMEINEIFAKKGEAYFRNLETNLLKNIKDMEPMIISCGGGMALRDENAALMKAAGTVVWLTATPDTILERVKDDDSRPLLHGNKNVEFIANLLNKRHDKYQAASTIVVATDERAVDDICGEIIAAL